MPFVLQPFRDRQIEQLRLAHCSVRAAPGAPDRCALPTGINYQRADLSVHGSEAQDALLVRPPGEPADDCLYSCSGNCWVDRAVCGERPINVLGKLRNCIKRGYAGRQKRIRTRICKSGVAGCCLTL